MLEALVLIIALVATLTFLVILLIAVVFAVLLVKSNSETIIPSNSLWQGHTTNASIDQNKYTPEFANGTVPIEQFSPNPGKEIKIKYHEDDSGLHGASIEEDMK